MLRVITVIESRIDRLHSWNWFKIHSITDKKIKLNKAGIVSVYKDFHLDNYFILDNKKIRNTLYSWKGFKENDVKCIKLSCQILYRVS